MVFTITFFLLGKQINYTINHAIHHPDPPHNRHFTYLMRLPSQTCPPLRTKSDAKSLPTQIRPIYFNLRTTVFCVLIATVANHRYPSIDNNYPLCDT